MMNQRLNFIKNATFAQPDYMPIQVAVSQPLFAEYGKDLMNLLLKYPEFFPDQEVVRQRLAESLDPNGKIVKDGWGCTWNFPMAGLDGIVTDHPLADWTSFADYVFPPITGVDKTGIVNLDAACARIKTAKANDQLAAAFLPHGYFLLRLQYLRGYENLMLDIGMEDQNLMDLVQKLTRYWFTVVETLASYSPDLIGLPEDLGAQHQLLISPEHFRKYVYPSYKLYVEHCRQRGIMTHVHSDGYILDIADDFVDLGVTIINPQDLCNGIDNLARVFKNRICIDLDIDRQKVIPFGSRNDIIMLIEEEVRKLGSPEGGLSMIVGLYPPTPLENIDALLTAFRKYRFFWSGKG